MPNKWLLKKITISGFRGYNGSQTLDLTAPLTLLEGPQRAGKSSTLAAIEWALFGKEVEKKSSTGIDERNGWEIRNRHSGEATVELTLSSGTDELKIVRFDPKRKSSSFFWVLNGQRSIDEGPLLALLGITPKDYFSSVHLHQEVVRALLIEEPRIRRDMLDRLLGLSDLRNILDGIKQGKLNDILKNADAKYTGIEDQLNAVIANKRSEIKRLKYLAANERIDGSCFTLEGSELQCQSVRILIEKFIQKSGLAPQTLPAPTNLEAQRSFSISAKNALRNLRNELPDMKLQQTLLKTKDQLLRLKTEFNGNEQTLRLREEDRLNIEQLDGSRDAIQLRINTDLIPGAQTAKARRNEINKRAGVIAEAINYFAATKNAAGTTACPVCEREISDVTRLESHLDELKESLRHELEPIEYEIQMKESEIQRLGDQIRFLESIEGEIAVLVGKCGTAKESIQAALGRMVGDSDDINAIVNAELNQLSLRVEGISQQIGNSNNQLNAIEDAIGTVEKVLKVLLLEEDIERFLRFKDSHEYAAVEQAKQELEHLGADVENVRETIKEVLETSAAEKLKTARVAIAKNFRQLAKRPDFQDIEIDPGTYEIMAVCKSERIKALTIFNQGDLNCAAISVFLGLGAAQEIAHNMDFVVMDDPSQSMDAFHKENLVTLLNSLPDYKQIVISTSEGDFVNAIVAGVLRKKRQYRFDVWSDQVGARPREVMVQKWM